MAILYKYYDLYFIASHSNVQVVTNIFFIKDKKVETVLTINNAWPVLTEYFTGTMYNCQNNHLSKKDKELSEKNSNKSYKRLIVISFKKCLIVQLQ